MRDEGKGEEHDTWGTIGEGDDRDGKRKRNRKDNKVCTQRAKRGANLKYTLGGGHAKADKEL